MYSISDSAGLSGSYQHVYSELKERWKNIFKVQLNNWNTIDIVPQIKAVIIQGQFSTGTSADTGIQQ